jgi:hypothetical protein
MTHVHLDRRGFLKATGAAAAAVAFGGPLFSQDAPKASRKYKTERVVLVAFAGGVRSRDTIGAPSNVPRLMDIAQKGVVMPRLKAANLGHFGATLSVLTGVDEPYGIRENDRGDHPTIFEVLRKQRNLGPSDVWLSATGGAQQRNLASSYDRRYGEDFAANLVSSDGVFNEEFRKILASFGKPRIPEGEEADALAKMRAALGPAAAARGLKNAGPEAAETARSIEKFLLDELKGESAKLTGPGAADAKTVRVAANLFRAFKPKFMGVVLQQADVAHGSYNGYVEVIRRNDAEVGRLWDFIQADPELRDTTTIFVVPEFGRDTNLNERNGLDHGDGGEDLSRVALIAAGPDFKRGKTFRTEARTIDVAPTMCELLDVKCEGKKAKALRDLFA